MTRNQCAERRLHWVLGICIGLVLGYIWGMNDAFETADTQIQRAHDISMGAMKDTEKRLDQLLQGLEATP